MQYFYLILYFLFFSLLKKCCFIHLIQFPIKNKQDDNCITKKIESSNVLGIISIFLYVIHKFSTNWIFQFSFIKNSIPFIYLIPMLSSLVFEKKMKNSKSLTMMNRIENKKNRWKWMNLVSLKCLCSQKWIEHIYNGNTCISFYSFSSSKHEFLNLKKRSSFSMSN